MGSALSKQHRFLSGSGEDITYATSCAHDFGCSRAALGHRLKSLAPGLIARSVLEKFCAVQMINVQMPTTDGRELMLTRYTQLEPELQFLLEKHKLALPPQVPPQITATQVASTTRVADLGGPSHEESMA